MATLSQSLETNTEGYSIYNPPEFSKQVPAFQERNEPTFNPYMRCPLPLVGANPDGLRQFYQGSVPQIRILPIITTETPVTGTTNNTVINVSSSVASTSGNTNSSGTPIVSKNAALISPVLLPNQRFTNSVLVSRSFQLLSVSANQACRVQLYGTAAQQASDSFRAVDEAPAAGITQNIISDVVLDTVPYIWAYQNRIGANGDFPQVQVLYVTITNLTAGNTAVTVSIGYVPLEV